jgi:NADPH2:quinone reductase
MKALEITEDHRLRLTEREIPVPGPDEALIRVKAAGVNRPDLLQRLGKYPPPPGASDIPGLEVAGTREDTGEDVCALVTGGGYAEYAVAAKALCLPIPAGLDVIRAAALPETAFTVWNNVFMRGHLRAGETLLVHGGASGIGTLAIQMAKALGAKIAVTAGSNDKCAACRLLGADLAINYKDRDFVEDIESAWGNNSIDVVLDMVGGPYAARNIRLLAPEGRHVSIAVQQGARAEIDLYTLMAKRAVLTGSTLRPRPVEEKAELAQGLKEVVWPLIESGAVLPVLYKTFPLDQGQAAHDALEIGDHAGKIVLTL